MAISAVGHSAESIGFSAVPGKAAPVSVWAAH